MKKWRQAEGKGYQGVNSGKYKRASESALEPTYLGDGFDSNNHRGGRETFGVKTWNTNVMEGYTPATFGKFQSMRENNLDKLRAATPKFRGRKTRKNSSAPQRPKQGGTGSVMSFDQYKNSYNL